MWEGDLLLSSAARWANLFNSGNEVYKAHYCYAPKSHSPNSSLHNNLTFLFIFQLCSFAIPQLLVKPDREQEHPFIRATFSVFSRLGISGTKVSLSIKTCTVRETMEFYQNKTRWRKENRFPVLEIQSISHVSVLSFHYDVLKQSTQTRGNVAMQQLLNKWTLTEKKMPH